MAILSKIKQILPSFLPSSLISLRFKRSGRRVWCDPNCPRRSGKKTVGSDAVAGRKPRLGAYMTCECGYLYDLLQRRIYSDDEDDDADDGKVVSPNTNTTVTERPKSTFTLPSGHVITIPTHTKLVTTKDIAYLELLSFLRVIAWVVVSHPEVQKVSFNLDAESVINFLKNNQPKPPRLSYYNPCLSIFRVLELHAFEVFSYKSVTKDQNLGPDWVGKHGPDFVIKVLELDASPELFTMSNFKYLPILLDEFCKLKEYFIRKNRWLSLLEEDEPNLDESVRSFSFQVKPAQVLKDAINVLCDGGVNERGFAYIHVDEKGVEINVDAKGDVAGLLWLSASKLMNFQCRRPTTEAQIINLEDLYKRLLHVSDDDTITVYHVEGSRKFSFIFDKTFPSRGISVDFHTLSDNIGKHPRINHYREATLTSVELRRLIQRRSHGPPIVMVEIENNKAVFDAIDESSLDLSLGLFKSHEELESKELGKTYCTWFHWNFGEALRKASYLSTEVHVCLSRLPTRDIVFQFNLAKFGDLLIVKRTLKTYPNVDDVERARLPLPNSSLQ